MLCTTISILLNKTSFTYVVENNYVLQSKLIRLNLVNKRRSTEPLLPVGSITAQIQRNVANT